MVTPKYRGAFFFWKPFFETQKKEKKEKVPLNREWGAFIGAKSVEKTFF
jgi:hypothetical protein